MKKKAVELIGYLAFVGEIWGTAVKKFRKEEQWILIGEAQAI